MDAAYFTPKRKDEGVSGLGLFDRVEAPDLRMPAPSAPGSATSEAAADRMMRSPFRRKSWRVILLTLGALPESGVLSREALSERAGIPQHVLCARLSELRPTWIAAVSGACRSAAGVSVDGYRITAAGRARLTEAA